jgi:hypothetical protein
MDPNPSDRFHDRSTAGTNRCWNPRNPRDLADLHIVSRRVRASEHHAARPVFEVERSEAAWVPQELTSLGRSRIPDWQSSERLASAPSVLDDGAPLNFDQLQIRSVDNDYRCIRVFGLDGQICDINVRRSARIANSGRAICLPACQLLVEL